MAGENFISKRCIEGIGEYVAPADLSWEAYSRAVRQCGLAFDPQHQVFDASVTSALRQLPEHDAPLGHNLAVLRNYLLHYLTEGKQEKAEEARNMLVQIGQEIGSMLWRGAHPASANPLAPRVSPAEAHTEYHGAVAMYLRLLRIQERKRLLNSAGGLFRHAAASGDWGLPPIEQTPFGRKHASAPPPTDSREACDIPVEVAEAVAAMEGMVVIDGAPMPHPYQSVENLSQQVKTEAIEIAREILEKLKIQYNNAPIFALLDANADHAQRALEELDTVIDVYQEHLQQAQEVNALLREDPRILTANDAIDFIRTQMALRALDRAEMLGNAEAAEGLRRALHGTPPRLLNPNTYTCATLFAALEGGMQKILAVLRSVGQEAPDQVEQGIVPQVLVADTQERQKSMESLAFDEQYQRLAAERRLALQVQLGQQSAPTQQQQPQQPPHRRASSSSAALPSASNPAKRPAVPNPALPAAGGSSSAGGMGALLSGADLKQIQSSIHRPTSGNFSATAPGSAQQVIEEQIRAGARRRQRQETEQRRQQQQQQRASEKQDAQKKEKDAAKEIKEKEAKEKEKPAVTLPPLPPRRDRDTFGRS